MFYSINISLDMLRKSYRKPNKVLLFLFTIVFVCFISCSDEEVSKPPVLEFITDSGFIYNDTTFSIGEKFTIGIRAWDEDDNITFFQILRDNGESQIFLDSGMNCADFTYKISLIKANDPTETWIFRIMDRDRNLYSKQLKINKSAQSQYGDIREFKDITISAQQVTSPGSFLSLFTGSVYNLDTAFTKQSVTDIIYYFDEFEATLSSPNESEAPAIFNGPAGLANWTMKRETRYDTTMITQQHFEQALNDSLLLAAYEPINAKRKSKYTQPGMVISIVTKEGKIGLINVIDLMPGADGFIKLSIKIQD